jgi:hypothetical protein
MPEAVVAALHQVQPEVVAVVVAAVPGLPPAPGEVEQMVLGEAEAVVPIMGSMAGMVAPVSSSSST